MDQKKDQMLSSSPSLSSILYFDCYDERDNHLLISEIVIT